jgi:23S rRNA (guanine2445-N2)-methyltransferase / 23S rRNA (guanine2069-N7)-methyltransferase
MNSPQRLSTYWVTCADGLETLLQQELQGLGIEQTERFAGRLIFQGLEQATEFVCGRV